MNPYNIVQTTDDDTLTYAIDVDSLRAIVDSKAQQVVALTTQLVYPIANVRVITYTIHIAITDAVLSMWVKNTERNYQMMKGI